MAATRPAPPSTPRPAASASFYGATAKEAAEKRTADVADRNRGALFSDPGRLTTGEYLERWLSVAARYQVAASTHGRLRSPDPVQSGILMYDTEKLRSHVYIRANAFSRE